MSLQQWRIRAPNRFSWLPHSRSTHPARQRARVIAASDGSRSQLATPPIQAAANEGDARAEPLTSSLTRRRAMLRSSLVPLVPLVIGSDDATTIFNSVLGAYGLPTLKASAGFKLFDESEDSWVFEYPRGWVARRNSQRPGVVISDFQTADKLAVEEVQLPANGDVTSVALAAAVTPGGGRVLEDATLNLPARRLVKSTTAQLDGQEYLYLEFPSETTTRSGYNIKRRNFVGVVVKRDRVFVIAASARSDQYNEEKRQLLQHCVQSFRVR